MGIKERLADEVQVSASGVNLTSGKLIIQQMVVGPSATDYTQVGDGATALLASKVIYCVLGRVPKAGKLKRCTIRSNTVGVAGAAIDLWKVASGVALASGTTMVTPIAGTAATAFTDIDLAILATGAENIAAGSLIVAKVTTGAAETLSPVFYDVEIWL